MAFLTMTLFQDVSRCLQSMQQSLLFDYYTTPRSRNGFEFAGESSTVVEVRQRRAPPFGDAKMEIRKDSSNNDKNTSPTNDVSSSSTLAWWLSSLLCGVSTALVYSLWVDYRRRNKFHRAQTASTVLLHVHETASDDSKHDYCNRIRNYMQTQSKCLAQKIGEHLEEFQHAWMHVISHLFLGSFLWGMLESSNSNSSGKRQTAPLLLVSGGGLAGFLFIRQYCSLLSPFNNSVEENDDESCYPALDQSIITPYLFLYYACPATQRVRLWFAWMALKWVDLASSTKRTTIKPGNGTKRYGRTLSQVNISDKSAKNGIHENPELERRPAQTSRSAMGPAAAGAETVSCDNASVGSSTPPPGGRYLELLVHNVSHTDFVLSLDIPNKNNIPSHDHVVDKYCLCRPRFSFFDTYCRMALESLSGNDHADDTKIVSFPRYKRALDDPRYVIREEPTGTLIPTGFELKPDPHLVANLSEVRVRGIDQAKVADAQQEDGDIEKEEDDGTVLLGGEQSPTSSWTTSKSKRRFPIGHVFFPLLATLLPHWQSQIAEKEYQRPVKRVLVLVTGVGTPRNFTHSLRGNSTQACAVLMERFLRRVDPGLTVVRIHSETNIFRYDDNLLFVERELMPVLNSYRDTHARGLPYPDEAKTEEVPPAAIATARTTKPLQPFNADWRKSLSVYVSFADGSPARTYAIQASMRPFRPTFFHFWQLKTFWHESKIVDDDLEVHSFEAMETSPPVDTNRLRDPQLIAVVAEMKLFREDMVKALQSGQHDIEKFWLRKTFKPVLAVLLVQSDNNEPILYRGTNMEVSMPTGSLCAERNVIGTALSANLKMKREDLKMIAVLAVPYAPTIPDSITGGGAGMKRINSTASFTSAGRKISIGSEQEEWAASSPSLPPATTLLIPPASQRQQSREDLASSFAMVGLNDVIVDSLGEHGQSTAATVEASNRQQQQQQQQDNSLPTTPIRKISLFSKSASLPDLIPARSDSSNSNIDNKGSKKKSSSSQQHDRHEGRQQQQQQQHRVHHHSRQYDKRTVVVHSSTDMNPLAPCGACNEWLKKIAESNPYFRIVTFTDADCNGVYCTNCQE